MGNSLTPLKINHASAVDLVVSSIRNAIIDGTFSPGDKIPSESELVEELGVGRSTVREAMKVLQACGIIEVRRGSGTYVAEHIDDISLQMLVLRFALLRPSQNDCWELREIFEERITRNAIHNASPSLISELQDNLNKMRKMQNDSEATAKLDLEFHHILAKATENSLIRSYYAIAMTFLEPSYMKNHRISNHVIKTLEVHKKTIDAIMAGDDSDEVIHAIIRANEDAWKT